MRSVAGLLVVALISVLAYRLYFSKMQSSETRHAYADDQRGGREK